MPLIKWVTLGLIPGLEHRVTDEKQAWENLDRTLPKLLELKRELEYLSDPGPFALDLLVLYFGLIAKWQDCGSLNRVIERFVITNRKGRHNEILECLGNIQKVIEWTGRDPGGWNRSETNEKVRDSDIHLGSATGLPVRPVAHWKHWKREKPQLYRAASEEARRLLQQYARSLAEYIGYLHELRQRN